MRNYDETKNVDKNKVSQWHRDRIEIFDDTMRQCHENPELIKEIEKSISGTEIIPENNFLTKEEINGNVHYDPINTYSRVSNCDVVKLTTGDAVYAFFDKYSNNKVAVLNFASATNPGGGVKRGSSAQEECLCRQSTLYPTIAQEKCIRRFYDENKAESIKNKNFYYNTKMIWSPNVVFFKDDNGNVANEPRYGINVITAAAPNLRMFSRSLTGDDFYHMILNRIRSVIRLAKEKDQKILILGAFGCGAFRNPPEIVAKAFAQAIDEIDDGEIHFIFAIRTKNEKETRNYKIFKRVLEDEE